MTNQEPEPLPLTYYTIYEALDSLLPDHSMVILTSIRKIIAIEQEMPGFGTMGITASGTLIIDRKFWNTYITSQDALQTLLYHELLHSVAGDMYNIRAINDDPKENKLRNMCDNIAMDSRINAFMVRTRPDIHPEEMMNKYFTKEVCEKNPLFNLVKPGQSKEVGQLLGPDFRKEYDMFYSSDTLASHHKLSDLIYEYIKKNSKNEGDAEKIYVKLLGAHGEGSEEDIPEGAKVVEVTMEELEEALKNKIAQKERSKGKDPQKTDQVEQDVEGGTNPGRTIKEAVVNELAEYAAGCGPGSKLYTQLLDTCLELTEKFDLERFKKMAFNSIFANVRKQARQRVDKYTNAPYIPKRPSVTDTLLLAAGIPIALYKHKKYAYTFNKTLLPIYLDVSGSTMPYLPEIVRLIANVSKELDYVWGFSTMIAHHTTQQLEEGKVITTGGTDFDCVINHALEKKFEHIVVITDGEAYTRHKDKVPGIKSVVTILFGSAWKQNYFTTTYGNTHMIDEVKI